ncbi:hypothetical protein ACFOHS_17010 [Jhaorihella thermophila]
MTIDADEGHVNWIPTVLHTPNRVQAGHVVARWMDRENGTLIADASCGSDDRFAPCATADDDHGTGMEQAGKVAFHVLLVVLVSSSDASGGDI